jgi:hypothetical protein
MYCHFNIYNLYHEYVTHIINTYNTGRSTTPQFQRKNIRDLIDAHIDSRDFNALQLFFSPRRVVKKNAVQQNKQMAELRDVSQAFACSEREGSFV